MSAKLETTLKGLILVGLALFLTNSIINGTLLFYINRRFAWLTWVATILLLLMVFAYQRSMGAERHQHDHSATSSGLEHGGGHSHPHAAHRHGAASSWGPLVLMAVPLLLGLLVPPQPLGAQAMGAREVNTGRMGLGNDETVLTRTAAERNILDWLRVFNAAGDPSALAGQEATVIGFVYRDETFAADRFMVSRFILTCCVADATAVGLIVSWPGSLDLPLDTWVEVHGAFQPGQFEGEETPILSADSVRPTTPPNQPYLYP
jgi:uncharacterized repeat protein (TIGR03943 family)